MAPTVKDTDPLDHLEERIQKAVTLVIKLREEKETLTKDCDMLQVSLEEAETANKKLVAEMDVLREERQQVRSRLEKLLGHIDQLGTA